MGRIRRVRLTAFLTVPFVLGAVLVGAIVQTTTPPWSARSVAADVNVDPTPFATATVGAPGAGPSPTPTPSATPEAVSAVVPAPPVSSSARPTPRPARTTAPPRVPPAPMPSDVALPAPVAASPTCTAVYTVINSWPGGYQAQITVTAGALAIDGWKVSWTMADGLTIGNMWGATPTTDGRSVTAASLSWNAQLAPGASATFGVTGTTTADPTALTASCGRNG